MLFRDITEDTKHAQTDPLEMKTADCRKTKKQNHWMKGRLDVQKIGDSEDTAIDTNQNETQQEKKLKNKGISLSYSLKHM